MPRRQPWRTLKKALISTIIFFTHHSSSHTHTHTHTHTHLYKHTTTENVKSSSFYFLSIFLLFNTVHRMNFICIFLARLCSFTILKVFLTHFFDNWYLLYQIVSQTSCDSFDKRMITANLIWQSQIYLCYFLFI